MNSLSRLRLLLGFAPRLLALLVLLALLGAAKPGQAQNLLVNGNFDSTPGTVYFDGSDASVADDVQGWLLFLGSADGSYILVKPAMDPAAGVEDLNLGIGPSGGGLRTATASRPVVIPLALYRATVTTDNYLSPAGAAFWIDWYGAGGNLISSVGGALSDPNGPLTYAPYTQQFAIDASAPLLAVAAGVRFESGNAGYNGLAADNFVFMVVPEPASVALAASGALMMFFVCRFRRA